MRGKIHVQKRGGQRQKIKIRYLATSIMVLGAIAWPRLETRAESCPSLRVVFARGSGGERWHDQNYLAFKSAIEDKLTTVSLNYEFVDLDYPAVAIGLDRLDVTIGAAVGTGDAYEFGESVDAGVRALADMTSDACPDTKYVIGGYSQGAMVVSKALHSLNANKIIYAATFGDPKIYLPEGEGLIPAACRGENLSDYRMYVPDCQAYKGLLGAYTPYEPSGFAGKVGTWCNRRDIFCSSRLSISDHVAYVAENLYEDASKVIFDKICRAYGLKNKVSSPHDTAILIDSSGSMMSMLDEYKTEALRLAAETLDAGGRVALFDYRDLNDPYDLVQHCGFDDCSLEVFEQKLRGIRADGGGDDPESLLSGAFHVMTALDWKQGSTKSLVILTDANFLSPDRDGMTFDEVVALSKRIDPVNFYIITTAEYGGNYAGLASATDGRVVTDFDELSLLTDYIMERYDSLPRVEEMGAPTELPKIEVEEVTQTTGLLIDATVRFINTGTHAMVVLNDKVLGITSDTEVTISGIDPSRPNTVTLIPLGGEVRGEAVSTSLAMGGYGAYGKAMISGATTAPSDLKAPATGRN